MYLIFWFITHNNLLIKHLLRVYCGLWIVLGDDDQEMNKMISQLSRTSESSRKEIKFTYLSHEKNIQDAD